LLIVLVFIPKIRLPVIFLTIGFLSIFIRLFNHELMVVESMRYGEVSGKVERLYFKNSDLRAIIKTDGKYEKLIASFRGIPDVKIGDELALKGFFVPLPKQVYPTYYDVESKNKFNKIAGYFSVKKIEVIKHNFSVIDVMRRYVLDVLNKFIKHETKSVALALIMGDKGLISKDDYNAFKKAGIAHILAISGLHMSIVCILIFTVIFRVLSVTPLYKYCDTKKIAGVVGILFGLFYLLLAGVPISGLRSFLMVILLFVSIFFLRGGGGFRSLAISLFLILLFWGEEVFFPSFQLSFVSVLCLLKMPNFNFGGRLVNAVFTTALSSILVSFLTLPFAIHHFSYVHFYGAISNVIAIPLLAFFVMPSAILSLTGFMPFIWLFEWGIDLLFLISNLIANLPFSSIFMPYFNGYLLSIYSFCLIFALCFRQKVFKITGLLGILVVTIVYSLTAKNPALVANEDYVVMKDGKNYISLFYIPSGFLKEVWEEKLNASLMPIDKAKLEEIFCDESACFSAKHKFTVVFDDTGELSYCTGGSLLKLAEIKENSKCKFKNILNVGDLNYTPTLLY
jgi:competence protein ComEC